MNPKIYEFHSNGADPLSYACGGGAIFGIQTNRTRKEPIRRLSAIMFTDMVGYTALMQEDERRATEIRDRHRLVLRDAIEAQGGEIIQFYGDGTLSVFPSAVKSVAAAIDIQQRLRKPPEIPVRIGLHVGDIVHDEEGIHGDGVNVAARVQGLATPGSVLLSGRVADEVRNHPEFPLRDLRRADNRVRITAQLICACDGFHMFSKTFDRVLDDIFAAQDEIAVTIAAELRVLLPTVPKTERPVIKKPTENAEAYAQYLRGLHCWHQWTPDTTWKALDHFRSAADLDPEFALAHTGIARGYAYLGALGKVHGKEAFPIATEAALKAIQLNSESGDAHLALGLVKLFYDWDLAGAKVSCERAVELSPGSAEIHHLFAYYYTAVGDLERAVEGCERAEALDPLSPMIINSLGRSLNRAGRDEEALHTYGRAPENEAARGVNPCAPPQIRRAGVFASEPD